MNGSLAAPANFNFEGGTLDLVGSLSFAGQFSWTGGSIKGPGTATLRQGATLKITTSATSKLANDALLVNHGTVTWNESGGELSGDGTIDNTGTFNINGQNPQKQKFANPIDGTFTNSGVLAVKGSLPTIDSLSSSGTINVSALGYLTIAGNSTISGAISAAAGTTVSFYGLVNSQGHYVPGVATIKPGTVFKGAGFYAVFDGQKLVLDTKVAPANFLVAGGTISGSGSLTATGELEFSGGKIAPAVVSVPASGTFIIDNHYKDSGYGWVLSAGTVNLAGRTFWDNGNTGDLKLGAGTTVNNLAGAVFAIQSDELMAGGTFNNLGTIKKDWASGRRPIRAPPRSPRP